MIRVQIVGRRESPLRDVATRLSSPSIEVIGSSRTIREALGGDADVVVVLEWDEGDMSSGDGDADRPAVLVLGDDDLAARLAAAGHAAWGLVPASTRPEALRAAVTAVAAGLVVVPAASAARWARVRPPVLEPDDEWPDEFLTPREHDVLEWASRGSSNREIAAALGISEHTVKFHLASVYGKLGVTSRTQAVRRGLRRGLLTI